MHLRMSLCVCVGGGGGGRHKAGGGGGAIKRGGGGGGGHLPQMPPMGTPLHHWYIVFQPPEQLSNSNVYGF